MHTALLTARGAYAYCTTTLPGQTPPQEIYEHIPYSFQIISPGLLNAEVVDDDTVSMVY
jgi:hypothetical protein